MKMHKMTSSCLMLPTWHGIIINGDNWLCAGDKSSLPVSPSQCGWFGRPVCISFAGFVSQFSVGYANVNWQVCCKKTGCAIDGADWLPAPVITDQKLQSAVTLNVSDCSGLSMLTGLRYGWRETPFQYLRATVYSKENNLPAPPFVVFFRIPEMHMPKYFVHRIK